MKQSERFKPVTQLTHNREQEAARRLSEFVQAMEQQRTRLSDLENYCAEYRKQFAVESAAGVTSARVQDFHGFLLNLDGVISQQRAAVVRLEREYEERKRQWLAARGRSQAIDHVVDTYRSAEQAKESRQDQAKQDDRATTRFFQQK